MCTLVKAYKVMVISTSHWNREKFSEMVSKCPSVMDGLVTHAYLNVLPPGSYDVLIGMDWLEAQRKRLDCYNKTFEVLG